MLHIPLPHKILLALAVLGWVVAIGGFIYARAFTSDIAPPKAVMSAQSFTSLFAIGAGLLFTVVVFVGSLLVYWFSSQESGTLLLAAIVSGAYAAPCVALLIYASYFK